MANTYKTKQAVIDEQNAVIDEQNEKIKNLEDKIKFAGYREDTHKRMLTREARKFSDIIGPEASITVCEDTYMPDTPATVLANIQVFEELFDNEVGGEMKTDLLKEMDKLSEALSEFYSALECEVRINMSINRN